MTSPLAAGITRRGPQAGFTLLEVMVALLIIGLLVGAVVVNFGGQDHRQTLKREAQRLQVVLSMASDYAVLNQRQLGIRFNPDENDYHFLRLDRELNWQPIDAPAMLAPHQLAEDYSVELTLEDLPWQDEDDLFDRGIFDETLSVSDEGVEIGEQQTEIKPPQVLIFTTGEITPFVLTLAYEPRFGTDNPVYFTLSMEDYPPAHLAELQERP